MIIVVVAIFVLFFLHSQEIFKIANYGRELIVAIKTVNGLCEYVFSSRSIVLLYLFARTTKVQQNQDKFHEQSSNYCAGQPNCLRGTFCLNIIQKIFRQSVVP